MNVPKLNASFQIKTGGSKPADVEVRAPWTAARPPQPGVSRIEKSAEEIQTEVQRRIALIPEVAEDGADIEAPRPVQTEPDSTGCNWTMGIFRGATGYEQAVGQCVEQVRQFMNLKSPPLGGSTMKG